MTRRIVCINEAIIASELNAAHYRVLAQILRMLGQRGWEAGHSVVSVFLPCGRQKPTLMEWFMLWRSCGGRQGRQLVMVVTVAAQIVLLQLVAGTAAAQFVTWSTARRSLRQRPKNETIPVPRLVNKGHVEDALSGKRVRLTGQGQDGVGRTVLVHEVVRLDPDGVLRFTRVETKVAKGTKRRWTELTRASVSPAGVLRPVKVDCLTKPHGKEGVRRRPGPNSSALFRELTGLLAAPVRDNAVRRSDETANADKTN